MTSIATRELRKLIHGLLSGDTTLNTLTSGNIRQGTPDNVQEYPALIWTLAFTDDEPYKPDTETGIQETMVRIEIYVQTNPEDIDPISDRVYELLHGQRLSNSTLIVYNSRRSSTNYFYLQDSRIWHILNRYYITYAKKP